MDISSLAQLEMVLQKAVNEALEHEVAQVVKEEIKESVQTVIYDSGNPIEYDRRNLHNGSLGDIEMMNHTVDNCVLEVSDNADYNHDFASAHGGYGMSDEELSKSLAYNIINGYGNKQYWYNEPRDFINDAREKLESGSAKSALVEGLSKRLGSGNVF